MQSTYENFQLTEKKIPSLFVNKMINKVLVNASFSMDSPSTRTLSILVLCLDSCSKIYTNPPIIPDF